MKMWAWFFSVRPVSFKQLLLLVAPAIAVGFLVRALLIAAIPQGYFGADSGSYYEFTSLFWNHNVLFDLNEKRRWFYPIFLFFTSVLPIPPWYSVPLIQHCLGLLSILGIGWSCAQVVNRPRLVVPFVGLICSLWPRTIWYEHEFIAESLQLTSFILVVALLLTPSIVRSRHGLVALMIAFSLLAGMKGSSRFIWLGCVIGLFLMHHDPRRWMWTKISAFLAAFSFLLFSTVGKNSQGDWLALSSSLPLVRLEGNPYPHYRSFLRDQIIESRAYGNNYPWKVKVYKKRLRQKRKSLSFSPQWAELVGNKKEFSKVSRAFWTDAVFHNPIRFGWFTLKTFGIALSSSINKPRLDPQVFWPEQLSNTQERMERKFYYFKRLFGVKDMHSFRVLYENGRKHKYAAYPLMVKMNQYFGWMGRDQVTSSGGAKDLFPSLYLKPMGFSAVFGVIGGITFSNKRLKILILFIPFFLYLAGTYAVGDAVSRYLQPVEWLGVIFAGVALDLVIGMVVWIRFRLITVLNS